MGGASPSPRPGPSGLPVVAIVGRPNVGKSTLFNRLIGQRKAIVDDVPGVTRDRNYGEAEWRGRRFRLIDTGGLVPGAESDVEAHVQRQSQLALAEADVVIFLFDGKSGLNPLDRDVVDSLRGVGKPVVFAVNKIDSPARAAALYEFYELGLEPLLPISAEHGSGVADLLDEIARRLPEAPGGEAQPGQAEGPLCIAVVGRPNVGKSTLINRLLGFERSVVAATPGTTRDSVDSPFDLKGEPCLLIDTAGIRRKARISGRLERTSVQRALRSVDRADLVIHILDGPEGVTDQDAQILGYAHQRGKAQLIAVNKWDLMAKNGNRSEDYYRREVYLKLPFLEFVPVVFIAAATGYGVAKMLETARDLLDVYRRRVSTSLVNQALRRAVQAHAPPLYKGKAVKFFYATQTGVRPPAFTVFVNFPGAVPEGYRRYLAQQLRQELGFAHAPLRLIFRARREERKGDRR